MFDMTRLRIISLFIIAFLAICGCAQPYRDTEEKRPIIYDDLDEAEMIARYLNHGYLDHLQMKSIFYDLHLIRVLYSGEIPCLNWSRFIPPEEIPVKDPEFSRQIDRCMIYPREIEGGMSYLFEEEWINDSNDRITVYYYFECRSGLVEFIGYYDETARHRFPEWWSEADKNLRLFNSRKN